MGEKVTQVTYADILAAFIEYSATRGQSEWAELWILCQRRMGALVKTQFLGKPPVQDFDIIITDGSERAMLRLKNYATAQDECKKMMNKDLLSEDDISKLFWCSYRDARHYFFLDLKRRRRLYNKLHSATEKFFNREL